ncbi:SMI1/KNR4 family protein [Macrococcus capreoli]
MKFNAENHISVDGDKIIIEDIKKFEAWRGYQLPKDFVEFTLKYPGASMSAEFDSEGRPGSMISNMLKFSKEGYSSIYVDEVYEINDFGPYVLFGEDPGGNFIAFDYSNDELNPAVVFIDHEELGLIELPEGKVEDDYTDAELDSMMSSEKLEDFPWAIHIISSSFEEFIDNLRFKDINSKLLKNNKNINNCIIEIKKELDIEISEVVEKFIKKYNNKLMNEYLLTINGGIILISCLNADLNSRLNMLNFFNRIGGLHKTRKFLPLIYAKLKDDEDVRVIIGIKNLRNEQNVVYIPIEFLKENDKIKDSDFIIITKEIEKFFNDLMEFLENKL